MTRFHVKGEHTGAISVSMGGKEITAQELIDIMALVPDKAFIDDSATGSFHISRTPKKSTGTASSYDVSASHAVLYGPNYPIGHPASGNVSITINANPRLYAEQLRVFCISDGNYFSAGMSASELNSYSYTATNIDFEFNVELGIYSDDQIITAGGLKAVLSDFSPSTETLAPSAPSGQISMNWEYNSVSLDSISLKFLFPEYNDTLYANGAGISIRGLKGTTMLSYSGGDPISDNNPVTVSTEQGKFVGRTSLNLSYFEDSGRNPIEPDIIVIYLCPKDSSGYSQQDDAVFTCTIPVMKPITKEYIESLLA